MLSLLAAAVLSTATAAPTLEVHPDGRFLQTDDGEPFFFLADTAWHLLSRTDREDADWYLTTRAAQGYTAIQTVVLAELSGLVDPTPQGHLPLIDNDPARPNLPYFEHVDFVVRRANELGMVVALLPTWGDKWNKLWGMGPEIFTPQNARAWGRFLGERYRNDAIVWVLGGDRPVREDGQRAVIEAMAAGLAEGDGGRHLMTFHPSGGISSSRFFHDSDWLDFNMLQSGHSGRHQRNDALVASDYARTPVKPTFDAEPRYENIAVGFDLENGRFSAHDVREAAYWNVFAGGLGHTYGCNDIWQMAGEGDYTVLNSDTPWKDAMTFEGATQMRHLRSLIESRPFFTRIPDQSMVVASSGEGADHLVATRDSQGTFGMVYLSRGRVIEVDLSWLASASGEARWFDPRDGSWSDAWSVSRGPSVEVEPPSDEDWVLVVDALS